MFVARIPGDAMAPLIPNGSYCLFRRVAAELPVSKILLLSHAAIDDPLTGNWIVRKASLSSNVGSKEDLNRTVLRLEAANAAVPDQLIELARQTDVNYLGELVSVLEPYAAAKPHAS